MAFVAEMYLDPSTEEAVRGTWEVLAQAGLDSTMVDGGYRPHVSLTLSDHIEFAALKEAMADFAASLQPFRLTLSSIGSFATAEGVLFFGVTVTQTLLEVHAEFSRIFAKHARQPYAYYRVGTWVPHCTLATGLDPGQLGRALEVARRTPLPLYASVHQIGLVDISGAPAERLALFQLGSAA